MSSDTPRPRPTILRDLLLIAGVPIVAVFCISAVRCGPDLAANEREACRAISEIRSALDTFRERHGQAAMDAWPGDVAGLRDFVPPGGTKPIELIGEEIAAADARRPNARPYRGYWLVLVDSGYPAEGGAPLPKSLRRTTVCAHPSDVERRGTLMYAIPGGWFKRGTKGPLPEKRPSDEELRSEWSHFD